MEEEVKKSDENLAATITKLAVTSKDADAVLKTVNFGASTITSDSSRVIIVFLCYHFDSWNECYKQGISSAVKIMSLLPNHILYL